MHILLLFHISGVENLHLFQILFHKGFQSLKYRLLKKILKIFKLAVYNYLGSFIEALYEFDNLQDVI
ncbi:hypothetical protein LCGC14_0517840 [marine sediment metagenome]|uniref:Uncharacterized protein n=1 Tax=marine sediment metagenome TaxID=412755 RepID=A0A0F9SHV5_9ZZZZ